METFSYSDVWQEDEERNAAPILLRTYDRNWRIDEEAMHYLFELRVWVSKSEDFNPMRRMDYSLEIILG